MKATDARSSHLHIPVFQEEGEDHPSRLLIPASDSMLERPRRTLKHGDMFGLFDFNGDVVNSPGSPDGLFYCDTRYLSHLRLTINGQRPMMLSSTVRDDNVTLTCDLTNPDLHDADGEILLEHDSIHISRSRFLWEGASYERLLIRNFDANPQRIHVELTFAADFADLFEVRGTQRSQRGSLHPPEVGSHWVTLSYTGLDDQVRRTTLNFDPPPDHIDAHSAGMAVELAPGESQSLFLKISCDAQPEEIPVSRIFLRGLRDASRSRRLASSQAASISTSNEIFNEVVRRSIADLYMLTTDTRAGPYPYAGVPWFSTAFGRDALITAIQTLWLDPNIARGVLNFLAAHQATSFDADADAEPGKILHEMRRGEMANLKEVPFGHYYGSIDSTPLFVGLAGAYLHRTGDIESLRQLWPSIEAALSWIEKEGDRDGDGFVEYGRRTAEGLTNQGWKDSHDSIFHSDGRLAHGPIALAEVQSYVYAAWRAAADIATALQLPDRAATCIARAKALRKAFDTHFYDEELGTYVLALDGDKRPCRVRTSNAGHALLTGIAYRERARSVVDTLMSAHSFCGWGVRTVASTESRYNPMSYHNGSVWPHDNALIAAGFFRYGFQREAAQIFNGLFSAATYIDLRRLPELFCGFPRRTSRGPTLYPVACSPQAWAATAPFLMLQSSLGLSFDPVNNYISFEDPALPDFLDQITFRNLTLGTGACDVTLYRAERGVAIDVLSSGEGIKVLTTTRETP